MMGNPRFQVQVGSTLLDSQVPSILNSVAEVCVDLGINGLANRASLTLGLADGLKISSADQPLAIPPIETGSLDIRRGDPIDVGLGDAEELFSVFSGEIDEIAAGIQQQEVKALDGARKLQALRVNQTYEQQTAGDLVEDLAARVGVEMAQKETGVEFPFYVIDDHKSGYDHILELARKIGFDFYVTASNQLVFKAPEKTAAVKTFRYGLDILQLEVFSRDAAFEKVEVRGESPASSQGIEKSHWLVKSFEDYLGVAGAGSTILHVEDPTIRTKATADAVASGVLDKVKAETIQGRLKILGAPDVRLGDVIEIADLPDETLNGSYHVRKIQHLMNQHQGFVSVFDITALVDNSIGSGV